METRTYIAFKGTIYREIQSEDGDLMREIADTDLDEVKEAYKWLKAGKLTDHGVNETYCALK